MLEIKNLTIKTIEGKTIIENLSLNVSKGERLAIIGEEGNGKSTLIKLIAGQNLDYAEKISGSVKCVGKVAYLPQNLDKYLNLSAFEFLMLNGQTGEMDYSFYKEISQKLAEFGLDGDVLEREEPLSMFSGGERIKIGLAKILATEPDILLLDEPTNDLDIETIEFLERVILKFKGLVVFISHDEKLLENCATCVLLIEQIRDKTMARCNFERIGFVEFMNRRTSSFEKQEQMAVSEHKKRQKQEDFLRKIQQKLEVDMAQNVRNPGMGRLLVKKMKNVKSQQARLERTAITEFPEQESAISLIYAPIDKIPDSKCVLNMHLPLLQAGTTILARDVNLEIYGAKKVAIIGKNGCGKTTLIKHILKELENKQGLKVGYFSQDYLKTLNPKNSAIEELQNNNAKVNPQTALACLNFTLDEMGKKIEELSEGQKAKILLMKLLLSGANVLVLDEPTRNLSPLSKPVVTNLLQKFTGAIIFVSHDRNFVKAVSNAVYELKENQLIKID